jgi:hypothetical protein
MSDYQLADIQERAHARKAPPSDEHGVKRTPMHPVVELGKTLGNAHVARLIAQREGVAPVQRSEVEDEEPIQAKHDPLQRAAEEDEEVQAKHDPLRRAAEEEELQMSHDETLQRRAGQTIGLEGGPVGADMADAINGARTGGSSLDGGVRSQVESALGADLSGVRVHQDSQSDALNRTMTAKAFTTGNDIFLRSDASASDTSLMAHELTHVVQQGSGAVGSSGGMTVGPAGDQHEQEADRVAEAITSGSAQRMGEEDRAG